MAFANHSASPTVMQQGLRPADASARAKAEKSLQLRESLDGFSPRDVKTMERQQALKAQEETQ
jgi:hypothetical protein